MSSYITRSKKKKKNKNKLDYDSDYKKSNGFLANYCETCPKQKTRTRFNP